MLKSLNKLLWRGFFNASDGVFKRIGVTRYFIGTGPKGVGFLYIQKDIGLSSLIFGGSQERGLRAGTEAVHNIVGMETALQISCKRMEKDALYIKDLKTYFLDQLSSAMPGTKFNGASGDIENSTYTIVNARLPLDEKKAQLLAFNLDLQGICCSKGSACHVILCTLLVERKVRAAEFSRKNEPSLMRKRAFYHPSSRRFLQQVSPTSFV